MLGILLIYGISDEYDKLIRLLIRTPYLQDLVNSRYQHELEHESRCLHNRGSIIAFLCSGGGGIPEFKPVDKVRVSKCRALAVAHEITERKTGRLRGEI